MTALTRLACLTPPGTGAIATLALRGPAAWTVVRKLAQRELPPEPVAGRFWLVRLGDTGRGAADDVVLAVQRGGPEPWLELHTHGGREVLRWLEELFVTQNVEVCTWQQLERASTGDPLRVATLATLAGALTARTAAIALDQVQGAFARALSTARSVLERGDRKETRRLLTDLMRWSNVGAHLTTPWRVVVAGAPNVGKSSLVNALAGYQRSVVSPLPGTTRDVVTTLLALDGWPIELADTAGWREAAEALERQGIERAGAALGAADLCLWVLDASVVPAVWPPAQLWKTLVVKSGRCTGWVANLWKTLLVINKADLPAAWPLSAMGSAVQVSAQTGAGLPELCRRIAAALVPEAPPPGTPVPFTRQLAAGVRQVLEHGTAEAFDALHQMANGCVECN
jgi:tRNA modification GTPase